MQHLFSQALQRDEDVVMARQRAAHIAALLGFDLSAQTRVATAVFEIARNALRYAGGGLADFAVDGDTAPQRLVINVRDRGPGIQHLDDVLAGRLQSTTGLGIGINGTRRLMDRFAIESSPNGTTVLLERLLPANVLLVTAERASEIAAAVQQRRPGGIVEEVQRENQELLRALDELQRQQQELIDLNRELDDTNRGLVALHGELDEKADYLRRVDEVKSRFLSNVTHEFRTPVNSIIGLCNLMIEDADREGRDPGPELLYIRKAADQLSEIVNDLLDLAKAEAGKIAVRPGDLDAARLFGALRGMLRPLLLNQQVALVLEDAEGLPPLHTDEGKVSQILRNLISNALKYTEHGEVRVTARVDEETGAIAFAVADTGIGIAADDQHRIFEEFAQVEHRLQGRTRGTGLGLPLSRKLAELLGGSLTLRSEPGVGSTFTLKVPIRYSAPGVPSEPVESKPQAHRFPLLVVAEGPDGQYSFAQALKGSAFQLYPAHTALEAERMLDVVRGASIILDLSVPDALSFLLQVKRNAGTTAMPVVAVGAAAEEQKAMAAGADAYLTAPVERRLLLDTLSALEARTSPPVRVLVVDDQQLVRFLMRQCLPVPAFEVTESESGEDALRLAREARPDAIVLDLVMPGMGGEEVLERLRADPGTASMPVVITTATDNDAAEFRRARERASAVVSKSGLNRDTLTAAVRAAIARERAVIREPERRRI